MTIKLYRDAVPWRGTFPPERHFDHRRDRAYRLYLTGHTCKQIGQRLRVGPARAHQLMLQGRRQALMAQQRSEQEHHAILVIDAEAFTPVAARYLLSVLKMFTRQGAKP